MTRVYQWVVMERSADTLVVVPKREWLQAIGHEQRYHSSHRFYDRAVEAAAKANERVGVPA